MVETLIEIKNWAELRAPTKIGHKIPGQDAPVIGDNVVISAGCKIIGKVNIGDNVIIAPNAVVVKDVPENCVVGGIPAQIIKTIVKKEI